MLLAISVVLAAPWCEELVFRGFLFRGFRQESKSPAAAIIVTSVSWAYIHGQYDTAGVLQVLGLGILLGIVRERTGSTKLTFVLHALFNAVAALECWVLWGVLDYPIPQLVGRPG